MGVHRFQIFADYFQFILMDEASEDDAGLLWTSENSAEWLIDIGQSTLGLGTLRNVDVAVDIHIGAHAPFYSPNAFDHLVEGSIYFPTGNLLIMGGTEALSTARRITVYPGSYRLLYALRGVETIKLEHEPADDVYSLFIWPAEQGSTILHKHWKSSQVHASQ
ncbi:hypothetical protein [Herbaspirillum chlorophenolicum]|uniref:hypothetical protein n=1 Tax=Herbaspirillum chlorophenolicum TaxID=211589 RepID=UPI00067D81DE|nr:hypothetical protein [Herbaspirillum chlorophenolicum]